MLDKIIKSLEPFQEFFHSKFQQDNEEAVAPTQAMHITELDVFTLTTAIRVLSRFL